MLSCSFACLMRRGVHNWILPLPSSEMTPLSFFSSAAVRCSKANALWMAFNRCGAIRFNALPEDAQWYALYMMRGL